MDDLLLSEVQVIVKNREKNQKYTVGLYWEVYFRKTKGITKILLEKKKKEKRKEKYWTQRLEKDWIKARKRRYAGLSVGHFLQAMNKAVTFIQTKV